MKSATQHPASERSLGGEVDIFSNACFAQASWVFIQHLGK